MSLPRIILSSKLVGNLAALSVLALAALDVHPRVAVQILRHSRISITMEIYTMVPDKVTLAAREPQLGYAARVQCPPGA